MVVLVGIAIVLGRASEKYQFEVSARLPTIGIGIPRHMETWRSGEVTSTKERHQDVTASLVNECRGKEKVKGLESLRVSIASCYHVFYTLTIS